jgi:hypothetical protein
MERDHGIEKVVENGRGWGLLKFLKNRVFQSNQSKLIRTLVMAF